MSFLKGAASFMDARPFEGRLDMTRLPGESLHDFVCRSYEAERMTVYRYLASLGAPPEVAKDLTQDLFLNLYSALRRGSEVRALRPWLFTSASHLFMNWRRGQATHPSISGEEADLIFNAIPFDLDGAPDETMIREQRLRAVAEAIQTLSPQQRICLSLRSEGLRYREIADVLGVSVPTVSEFVRRAIARLRTIIDV